MTGAAAMPANCRFPTPLSRNKAAFARKRKKSRLARKNGLARRETGAYTALPPPLRRDMCGPFVYRLGRQVFNLERGVRFP